MTRDDAIWITGVGATTSLGNDFAHISAGLLAGQTEIRPVEGFSVADHPCQIANQLTMPECPNELESSQYDSKDPLRQCALWCSVQALKDAGIWDQRDRLRVGLILGFAAEWMSHWDTDWRRGGALIIDSEVNHPPTVDAVSQILQLDGPVMSVAAACASGNHALAQASNWLRMGWVDVCLAGACDVGVTPCSLASFGNLRALSRRNESPAAAVRPFDCDRDGMVLGEGGAIFVLERADRARARRSAAYAEVAGVGLTSDAHHLVIPDATSKQAIVAMRQALAVAQVNADEIDYINAHATGTQVGDACEARMLQTVLAGNCAKVPVSSTKSMTGHLLSAAAAIEALACMAAITYGAIPPTINLDRPDPQCELCHVANTAREHPVRVAISNSFGFGGHNTSLVLRAVNS